MKSLVNLPADIYSLLDRGVKYTPDPLNLSSFGTNMAEHITSAMGEKNKPREHGKMWFSDLGEKCDRKNWYKWNDASAAESLPGAATFKFLYGNTLEEVVLLLARESGHSLGHLQARVEHTFPSGWRISGRVDATIDGVLVDVKSTSSYGYNKYVREGLNATNDSFGYRAQLSGYYQLGGHSAWRTSDPAFLFIDKQNGHIGVVRIDPLPLEDIVNAGENISRTVEVKQDTSVPRAYVPKAIGKSGNEGLGVECSYCPYKWKCWPDLKGYAYSTGPVYLTKTIRRPDVPEITHG
jgi:hypothetical protein